MRRPHAFPTLYDEPAGCGGPSAKLFAEDYKAVIGRATINIKCVREKPFATFNPDTHEMEASLSAEAARQLTKPRAQDDSEL